MQFSEFTAGLKKYERHISAISMIAGFAFDNFMYGRIDHPRTLVILFTYLSVAIASTVLMHFIESRTAPEGLLRKLRALVIAASQFALGALWSAFLVFYGRSAVFAASWPFLIVLAAVFIGNEVLKKYHDRLVFTCTLLFFALFSFAIFAVPMFTGSMGQGMFLLSGAIATGAFALIIVALAIIGPGRMGQSWKGIAIGAAAVLAVLNVSYFTNVLPPLPLALSNAGIFYSVTRDGGLYRAIGESRGWMSVPWAQPVMRVRRGESLYLYSAVFAPIQLRTKILHVWQLYDDAKKSWNTQSVVSYPIMGGRDGGYRGYSVKSVPARGRWRVNIETADGLLIGRVAFSVVPASNAVARVALDLK